MSGYALINIDEFKGDINISAPTKNQFSELKRYGL
jgi:hypothetical protein